MEKLSVLLVLRRHLLLELIELIQQLDRCASGVLSSPEYARVLASVQKCCRTREGVFRADADLLPYVRRDIGVLSRDADLLRAMLAGAAAS